MDLNRKVKKQVGNYFGENPQVREFQIPEELKVSNELLKEKDRVYSILGDGGQLGYLISTRAKGRYEEFDYSVIFAEDLSVIGVLVTTYRSTHGVGICSKGWLKQFHGYRGEELMLGKDIDSISGATISATSIVADIRRCYQVMESLITPEAFNLLCPVPHHHHPVLS